MWNRLSVLLISSESEEYPCEKSGGNFLTQNISNHLWVQLALP
jgi:hypothetical protein